MNLHDTENIISHQRATNSHFNVSIQAPLRHPCSSKPISNEGIPIKTEIGDNPSSSSPRVFSRDQQSRSSSSSNFGVNNTVNSWTKSRVKSYKNNGIVLDADDQNIKKEIVDSSTSSSPPIILRHPCESPDRTSLPLSYEEAKKDQQKILKKNKAEEEPKIKRSRNYGHNQGRQADPELSYQGSSRVGQRKRGRPKTIPRTRIPAKKLKAKESSDDSSDVSFDDGSTSNPQNSTTSGSSPISTPTLEDSDVLHDNEPLKHLRSFYYSDYCQNFRISQATVLSKSQVDQSPESNNSVQTPIEISATSKKSVPDSNSNSQNQSTFPSESTPGLNATTIFAKRNASSPQKKTAPETDQPLTILHPLERNLTKTTRMYTSERLLEKCCEKLQLSYSEAAFEFWCKIKIKAISPNSKPEMLHMPGTNLNEFFGCISIYFTGSKEAADEIQKAVNKFIYIKNTESGAIIDRKAEEGILFSKVATESHIAAVAERLSCRIGVYEAEAGVWKIFGDWEIIDADIPTMLMEKKNDGNFFIVTSLKQS